MFTNKILLVNNTSQELVALAGEIPPEYYSVAAFAAGSLSLAASYFIHKRYFRLVQCFS